jgi:hypothetical protein
VQPEIAVSVFTIDEQRFLLLTNGGESLQNLKVDPAPVVRLFTPDACPAISPEFITLSETKAYPKCGWRTLSVDMTTGGNCSPTRRWHNLAARAWGHP